MKLKLILSSLFALLLFLFLIPLLLVNKSLANEKKATLYFFWAKGCPHCAKEEVFLQSLKQKYPQLEIKDFEITTNKENLVLLQKIGQKLKVDISGVPFTVVGKEYVVGFLDSQTTGKKIEAIVSCALETGCQDIAAEVIGKNNKNQPKVKKQNKDKNKEQLFNLPFLGKVDLKKLSLPVLTFFIALLDGFNPCAMWTLLFLISLLLGMKDKKRMWILGGTFIFASGLVYFLFLSAWLNLFLFLGLVVGVRIIIGLIALLAGGYYLKDFCQNKSGGCQTVGDKKREKFFSRIKNITYKKQFILALTGIVLLAFAVNLVELLCSAGLPAVYTQILSLAKLSPWQYYLYLVFYIFIFMLDDLVVFIIAMTTLHAVGIQGKYARYSRLAGGLLMLLIGILMLFKPELLMFG